MDMEQDQQPVIAFLARDAQRIETAAAHVFLRGDTAYKLKKAIKLPYLDYSTLAQRKSNLDREFEINRKEAPQLYRGVRPIVRGAAGALRIGGEGEIVDWVLEMQRFPDRSLLSDVVEDGGFNDELALDLAEAVAGAHRRARVSDWDPVSIMAALEEQLLKAFESQPGTFPAEDFGRFASLYVDRFRRLKPVLVARGKAGLVRHCHGDLHCGNIVVIEGKPLLFDAIEFSERIATTDVLYDLAFLLMDLLRRGERRGANFILNRYFDLRRKEETPGAAATLPLFLATRAGVRALVAADRSKELKGKAADAARREAADYFYRAIGHLTPEAPRLIAVGGLSGTGKTVLARAICAEIPPQPGAFHIRSDIERKRLYRRKETEPLPPDAYAPDVSAEVYDIMLERAGDALSAEWPVVLDAVFAKTNEREMAKAAAARHDVAFVGLWLEARADEMKSRVSARRGDASDANAAVVDKQLGYDLGVIDWHRIDASGTPEETYERAMRVMLSSMASTSSSVL
ncbi:MAG: AAA family ATPase [Rhizobiales bacterium]|nr:AAA family ATPase [Hyphomicrobiales bacterium]